MIVFFFLKKKNIKNVKPQPIALNPPNFLPDTLKLTAVDENLQNIVDLLSKFEDRYCFAVRPSRRDAGASGVILIVYVGKLRGEGWAGLVGAGVWMK
jgi:hypothetical protein